MEREGGGVGSVAGKEGRREVGVGAAVLGRIVKDGEGLDMLVVIATAEFADIRQVSLSLWRSLSDAPSRQRFSPQNST